MGVETVDNYQRKYEPALRKLREKWPVDEMSSSCFSISHNLGSIVQKEFPGYKIFITNSYNLNTTLMPWASHWVSVIQEDDSTFVALDATRPAYEKGQECWFFKASTLDKLMKTLEEHYTGKWKMSPRWNQSGIRRAG